MPTAQARSYLEHDINHEDFVVNLHIMNGDDVNTFEGQIYTSAEAAMNNVIDEDMINDALGQLDENDDTSLLDGMCEDYYDPDSFFNA